MDREPTGSWAPGRRWLARRAWMALLLLGLSIPMIPGFDLPCPPQDEGLLLVYPERVLQGDVPNRDFFTVYGPANYWVLATAFRAFEPSVTVERSVGLAYRLAIVAALFELGLAWGLPVAVGSAGLAGGLLLPLGLAALSWLAGLAVSLWSLVLASRRPDTGGAGWWPSGAAGVLAGLMSAIRLDLALVLLPASIPGILAMTRRSRWAWAAGLALGAVPMVWHLARATPGAVFENLFVDAVLRNAPGRWLPLPPASSEEGRILGLAVLGAVGSLGVGAFRIVVDRRDRRALSLGSLGLFATGILPYGLHRPDQPHILCVAVVSLPALAITAGSLGRAPRSGSARAARAVSALRSVPGVLAVLVLVGIAAPRTLRAPVVSCFLRGIGSEPRVSFRVEHEGRSCPVPDPRIADEIRSLLVRVEAWARPGDRLFVGPADLRRTPYNETFLYFLLPGFEPASYFLEMNPGSPNRPGSGLPDQIGSADLLVLTHRFDGWTEPNASGLAGPDTAGEVVRTRFRLCARVGPYEVHRRSDGSRE